MILKTIENKYYDTETFGLDTMFASSGYQESIIKKRKYWYIETWFEETMYSNEVKHYTKLDVVEELEKLPEGAILENE